MWPVRVAQGNGYDVTIASVRGGPVPVDAASLAERDSIPEVARFMADGAWGAVRKGCQCYRAKEVRKTRKTLLG